MCGTRLDYAQLLPENLGFLLLKSSFRVKEVVWNQVQDILEDAGWLMIRSRGLVAPCVMLPDDRMAVRVQLLTCTVQQGLSLPRVSAEGFRIQGILGFAVKRCWLSGFSKFPFKALFKV